MAFERFTETGRGFRPIVSIWKRGQVGFNSGAVKKYGLDKNSYVVFFYDKDSNRIGFKFTGDENEKGISKLNVKQNSVTVGARTFLDYYDIPYEETKQYEMKYDQDEELYYIELDNPVRRVNRGSRRG